MTSYFLITVNSNKVGPPPAGGGLGNEMQRIGALLTAREQVRNLAIVPRRAGAATPPPAVTGVGARGRTEVGGVMGRVHQHILLRVDHTSQMHLDIPAIVAFYAAHDRTGLLGNVYVNVHGFSDIRRVVEYIDKQDDAAAASELHGAPRGDGFRGRS